MRFIRGKMYTFYLSMHTYTTAEFWEYVTYWSYTLGFRPHYMRALCCTTKTCSLIVERHRHRHRQFGKYLWLAIVDEDKIKDINISFDRATWLQRSFALSGSNRSKKEEKRSAVTWTRCARHCSPTLYRLSYSASTMIISVHEGYFQRSKSVAWCFPITFDSIAVPNGPR